jgi:hypothetical protein
MLQDLDPKLFGKLLGRHCRDDQEIRCVDLLACCARGFKSRKGSRVLGEQCVASFALLVSLFCWFEFELSTATAVPELSNQGSYRHNGAVVKHN